MKGLEFLGQLTKQVALSTAGAWWFQGSREMEQDATTDGSESQSALASYLVKPSKTQHSPDNTGAQIETVAPL